MAASPTLKKQLKKASGEAVRAAVIRLRNHLSLKRWIGPNNIYARLYTRRTRHTKNPSELIRRRAALQQRQIADYIAASIFTHCSDGWSLLGRSISMLVRGDSSSSVHLAYYAELRAAMSLLATEGVGVFNSRHVIMTDSPSRSVTTTGNLPTHQFVWDTLEYWADRKLSVEIMGEIITPGGISIQSWFDAFGIGVYLHPVGRSWLRSWGIDIKQFSDDRALRNHSSYRPSRIIPKTLTPAQDALSFSSGLWKMCEPNPTSRFGEIDRHLLRESLAQVYASAIPPFVDPRNPRNKSAYRTWIERGISSLGFSPTVQKSWVDFLTWDTAPNRSRVLEEASGTASVDDPDYHLQVLGRAILLLRISTGISGKILRDAGFNRDDLEFWWHPYAVDHGLIDSVPISDFLDLWADVDVALQDIENWRSVTPVPYSYNQITRNISYQLSILSECERISLWGLGI